MATSKSINASFSHRLLRLISEPSFIKFENILSEPNFFTIVGRTHYERWHSAFWGWLLDSSGSHLLSDYVFKQFLLLLLDEGCLKSSIHNESLLVKVLPLASFSELQVTPNENVPTETSVSGIGRFDIFLSAKYIDFEGNSGNLNIIFEMKIDSKPNSSQSTRYADWLLSNHVNNINLLIYITPKLAANSKSTVGDSRWYCFDYQLLNDKLLLPLLDHPNLNEKVKPFILQYVKNLKNRYRGVKMAITNEEKALALALYEKYSDVFDSIYDALVASGSIDFSTSEIGETKGRASGVIAIRIGTKILREEKVRSLYLQTLHYLVDTKLILKLPLPWGTGKTRYLITNALPAVHPNGKPFFYPESYQEYTIECHVDRSRALKLLADLCNKLEVDFEIINT